MSDIWFTDGFYYVVDDSFYLCPVPPEQKSLPVEFGDVSGFSINLLVGLNNHVRGSYIYDHFNSIRRIQWNDDRQTYSEATLQRIAQLPKITFEILDELRRDGFRRLPHSIHVISPPEDLSASRRGIVFLESVCDGCGEITPFRCPQCMKTFYCSQVCRDGRWNEHQQVCNV